jgi:hypothetical protein
VPVYGAAPHHRTVYLCVIWLAANPLYFPVAFGYYRIYRTPFLLLTLGGIDALDVLIQTNRFIKF